jgi:hypothetical protein
MRGQASRCNQLLARRGGVNLQPEVAPHQTERPPRDCPVSRLPQPDVGGELNIQADGAGRTAFRGLGSLQPAPLLNSVVRPLLLALRTRLAGGYL